MIKYSDLSEEEKMLYRSIKKSNDMLIHDFSKKHNISEQKLKENIDYCLDKERLKKSRICNKSLLNGRGKVWHYHFKRLCVIEYKIIDIGQCKIAELKHIYTEEQAHKKYKRDSR